MSTDYPVTTVPEYESKGGTVYRLDSSGYVHFSGGNASIHDVDHKVLRGLFRVAYPDQPYSRVVKLTQAELVAALTTGEFHYSTAEPVPEPKGSNQHATTCHTCSRPVAEGEGYWVVGTRARKRGGNGVKYRCTYCHHGTPAPAPEPTNPEPTEPTNPEPTKEPTMSTDSALVDALRDAIGAPTIDTDSILATVDTHVAERMAELDRILAEAKVQRPVSVTATEPPPPVTLPSGTYHDELPNVLRILEARDHRGYRPIVFLSGPAGTGKSSIAHAVAEAYGGVPIFEQGGSVDMMKSDLFGFLGVDPDPNPTPENTPTLATQLRRFMEANQYGPAVLLGDECDAWAAEVFKAGQTGLASRVFTFADGVTLTMHPDSAIILTANTWGTGYDAEYVGSSQMDAAILDRAVKYPIGYSASIEEAIAAQYPQGNEWLATVRHARTLREELKVNVIASTRSVEQGCSLLAQGFTKSQVVRMTFGYALDDGLFSRFV